MLYVLTITWLSVLAAVWVCATAIVQRDMRTQWVGGWLLLGCLWLGVGETWRTFADHSPWIVTDPWRPAVYRTTALLALLGLGVWGRRP